MNSEIPGIISAATALVATTVGPYIAMRTARDQIKASVLSTNRARWIENLRDQVASLTAQMTTYLILRSRVRELGPSALATAPDLLARVEQGAQTLAKIRLLLNPTEPDSRRLIELLDGALASLRSADPQEPVDRTVRQSVDEALKLTQSILKQEWTRVKRNS